MSYNFSHLFVFTPREELQLQKRLVNLLNLKNVFTSLQENFSEYVKVGSIMVKSMKNLTENFSQIIQSITDPALQSIIEIFNVLIKNQEKYVVLISTQIIPKISEFLSTNICNAETTTNQALSAISKYVSKLDQRIKNPEETKEHVLMLDHWMASKSSFDSNHLLDIIDKKKLLNVTFDFLTFLKLTFSLYGTSSKKHKKCESTYFGLLETIPETLKEVNGNEAYSLNQKQSLERAFHLYWQRTEAKFTGTNLTKHHGYLWQEKIHNRKTKWKRRFFNCDGGKFVCLEYDGSAWKPTIIYQLVLSSVKPNSDPKKPNSFLLSTPEETICLKCICQWDMFEWIGVIQNNIKEQLDHSPLLGQEETENSQLSKLKSVMEKPCADCGALSCTWCAINFGCFPCIECSGTHRSLTTSVSKIRSVTLDSLDDWILGIQVRLGNEIVNNVLEANVGTSKITSSSSRKDRDNFIRLKYKDKAFCAGTPLNVDLNKAIASKNLVSVHECVVRNGVLASAGVFSSIHFAAAFGDQLILGLIALNSSDLNTLDEGRWSPLCYAAYFGHLNIVQLLLSLGDDPNSSIPNHPYDIALSQSHTSVSTILFPYWKEKNEPKPPCTLR